MSHFDNMNGTKRGAGSQLAGKLHTITPVLGAIRYACSICQDAISGHVEVSVGLALGLRMEMPLSLAMRKEIEALH
jgi:hypothetical protein